jgi:hypothetical protein
MRSGLSQKKRNLIAKIKRRNFTCLKSIYTLLFKAWEPIIKAYVSQFFMTFGTRFYEYKKFVMPHDGGLFNVWKAMNRLAS